MTARVFVLLVALIATSALPPEHAHAQASASAADGSEARAREAFQRGRIHYDNGEFGKAAASFEEAYSLSGRDALLYNLYLAYRDANEQKKAAESLKNYLTRVEVIENRAQLEARLKALEEGIALREAEEARKAEEERAAQAAPDEQPAVPQDSAPAAQQAAGKWWMLPVVVMGVGSGMMLGAVPTGVMANSKQQKLEDECTDGVCDASLQSTRDSGETLALVSDVLLFGGAAVAATGAVLLFLKKPKDAGAAAAERPAARVACTQKGCAGSLSVRF